MTTTRMTTAAEAYAHCVDITRSRARNFFYGIRLLPKEKREALCAAYALSRRIDDIGDEPAPLSERKAALEALRQDLVDPAASGDPVLFAVSDAARRFPIPLPAFGELIDGVAMDVEMDATGRRYADFAELTVYCRRVAGAVGRLCLGVFGSRSDPAAADYADALGVAMQQVNILRDIREDLHNGRVYLPQEDLDRFGVRLRLDEHGVLDDADGTLAELIGALAARARQWYDRGLQLVPLLDWRSAACCTAMSGIYRCLLERIAARPELVYDRRLSLSGREKAVVAARALLGVAR
jgi:15-cis-phytoene synthase